MPALSAVVTAEHRAHFIGLLDDKEFLNLGEVCLLLAVGWGVDRLSHVDSVHKHSPRMTLGL